MTELNNADGWLAKPEYEGLTIMDPDGWDRKNYDESWAEEITQEEFEKRVAISTISFRWDSPFGKKLMTARS